MCFGGDATLTHVPVTCDRSPKCLGDPYVMLCLFLQSFLFIYLKICSYGLNLFSCILLMYVNECLYLMYP